MGLLGDLIGHRRALLVTKALVVLGAVLCTMLPAEASDDFWTRLALWRFIVGVGGKESALLAKQAAEDVSSMLKPSLQVTFVSSVGQKTHHLSDLCSPDSIWRCIQ